MFINNWYVACAVSDLGAATPFGVRMLGCDFVLFHDEEGEIRCLSAVCCHRGASLAGGRIDGGAIACPYHGWAFGGGGECVRIPALGRAFRPPRRARVDSYPVREKFGWIWVFLGDAPEEERPPFLDDDWFPEFYDKRWRALPLSYEAPVNWQRSEENSIDGAHPSFVHSAFGSRRDPSIEIVPIHRTTWGASSSRERTPPERAQKSGTMLAITPETRGRTRASLQFCFTGVTHRIEIVRADGIRQVTLSHTTPIDEYTTRTFSTQARDHMLEPYHDAERLAGRHQAIAEDIAVVSTVRPRLPPRATGAELLTEADQLEAAFRAICREVEAKGWAIDSDRVRHAANHVIHVIPSPARRDGGRNWVHKSVPTTRARTISSHPGA